MRTIGQKLTVGVTKKKVCPTFPKQSANVKLEGRSNRRLSRLLERPTRSAG